MPGVGAAVHVHQPQRRCLGLCALYNAEDSVHGREFCQFPLSLVVHGLWLFWFSKHFSLLLPLLSSPSLLTTILPLGWLPGACFDMPVRYCNLCGCPLSSCLLRSLSTAQRGDNPDLLWDDTCTCKGDSSDSDSDIESGHAHWCQYLLGYDGQKLSQTDIDASLLVQLNTLQN